MNMPTIHKTAFIRIGYPNTRACRLCLQCVWSACIQVPPILADGIPDRVTVALRFPGGSWRHRTAAGYLIVGGILRLWLK